MENWLLIKGFENYEVSDSGLIRSNGFMVNRGKGKFKMPSKILHPKVDKDGYLEVNLYQNGKSSLKKVHRLVAYAFISNTSNKPEINHIDGIKTNNYSSNLEWCTKEENQTHALANNIRGKNADKPITQYDLKGNQIKNYPSISQASKDLKLSAGNIWLAANGNRKTCGGFVWKYLNQD